MFGSAIWDKLPKCISENLENSSKIKRVIYPKNCPNQTCDYCLITQNQQILCIETNIFFTAGNYKPLRGQLQNSWQLQNNSVNGALTITINCVIITEIVINITTAIAAAYTIQTNFQLFLIKETRN